MRGTPRKCKRSRALGSTNCRYRSASAAFAQTYGLWYYGCGRSRLTRSIMPETNHRNGHDCGDYAECDPYALAAATTTVTVAVLRRHARTRRGFEKVTTRRLCV